MKKASVFLALSLVVAYGIAATQNYDKVHAASAPASRWCNSLTLPSDGANAPAGAKIGKPYIVSGHRVLDWTWDNGVTVSWVDGQIVYKKCG